MYGRTRLFLGDQTGTGKVHDFPDTDISLGPFLPSLQASPISTMMGDSDDATFAFTTSPGVFVVRLKPITEPPRTAHTLRMKVSSSTGESFKLSLYQGNPLAGGTLIVEFTQAAIPSAITNYSKVLGSVEMLDIVSASYAGNLYLRGEAL